MTEKRRFTRVELKGRARVRAGATSYEGEMKNLSLSGVFVCSPGAPKLGTEVELEMMVAGPKTELAMELSARVARHDEEGFGLAFDFASFELDSFLHLRNVIAYLQGDAQQIAAELKKLLAEQATQGDDFL